MISKRKKKKKQKITKRKSDVVNVCSSQGTHVGGRYIGIETDRYPSSVDEAVFDAVVESKATLVPFDENLIDRARTQWQFGDWDSLAQLQQETLQHNPDRAKLALLAAAGHMQLGSLDKARQLVRLAQDWGCSKNLIGRVLASGVYNSLGKVNAVLDMRDRAYMHFEKAVFMGVPGGDIRLITEARIAKQLGTLETSRVEGNRKLAEIKADLKQKVYDFTINTSLDKKSLLLGFSASNKHCFVVSNGRLNYQTENGEPLYFISNETGDFNRLLDRASIEIEGGEIYLVKGKLEHSGDVEAVIWVFQYSKGEKIEGDSYTLTRNSIQFSFRALPNADSVAIGIRLSGSGELDVNNSILAISSSDSKGLADYFEGKLEKIKNEQKRNIENATRQIEASIRLQSYLGADLVLPEMHKWPISPDLGVLLINLIESEKYDAVVEFGSGTSTLIMATALKRVSQRTGNQPSPLLSFEHLEEFREKTYQLLKLSNLTECVDVVLSRLVSWKDGDGTEYYYYDCRQFLADLKTRIGFNKSRILVFVDGPPAATGQHARYPALPILMKEFENNFELDILMDDYMRKEEQEIVEIWKDRVEERGVSFKVTEYKSLEKMACLLNVICTSRS